MAEKQPFDAYRCGKCFSTLVNGSCPTCKIRFDEDTHAYYAGEQRLISVTQALNECDLRTIYYDNEEAKERGRMVHKACQFLDEGDLDWGTVDPRIEGYVRAWEKAKDLLELSVLATEFTVYNSLYGYAGRPDVYALVGSLGLNAVIDRKTGEISPVTALQLAAYGYAIDPNTVFGRFAVHLRSDGTFKVLTYPIGDYRRDVADFLSVLRVVVWQQRNTTSTRERQRDAATAAAL